MKFFMYWTADFEIKQAMIIASSHQFRQLRIEAWKSQDFNGVWTRDLAIPVRRTNQLSYEATVSVSGFIAQLVRASHRYREKIEEARMIQRSLSCFINPFLSNYIYRI